jgi:DNA-binding XRE family transcriptional regulator
MTPDGSTTRPVACPHCGVTRVAAARQDTGIGAVIRSLRKELGLTQEALGNKILLRRNTVSQMETGSSTPTPQVVVLLLQMARENGPQAPVFREYLAEYRHKNSMPESMGGGNV